MFLATGENEVTVVHLLYLPSQQSLNILLRVFADLLELINGYYAGFVRILQILENLLQRIFRLFNIA